MNMNLPCCSALLYCGWVFRLSDDCARSLQAVGDIVVGSVLGPSSQRANESRIAMFLAGFPETVPVRTVNRYLRCETGIGAEVSVG